MQQNPSTSWKKYDTPPRRLRERLCIDMMDRKRVANVVEVYGSPMVTFTAGMSCGNASISEVNWPASGTITAVLNNPSPSSIPPDAILSSSAPAAFAWTTADGTPIMSMRAGVPICSISKSSGIGNSFARRLIILIAGLSSLIFPSGV